MGIRQTTPESDIDKLFRQQIERAEQQVIYNLAYIGEQCLAEARSTNSYKDRTGNLRSSIGYVIVKNGRIIRQSNFATVQTGSQGKIEGEQYARSVARNFTEGITLIVVAGMNYASYVSARGFNVLDSAELLAKKIIPKMLKQLKL
jgi:hypothetical protein